jgi:hypothetical protein
MSLNSCYRALVVTVFFASSIEVSIAQQSNAAKCDDDSGPVVGQVLRADGRDHEMYRGEDLLCDDLLVSRSDSAVKPKVWLNDYFVAPEGGNITLNLPNVNTIIEMEDASLELVGNAEKLVCKIYDGTVRFNGETKQELDEQEKETGCCVETPAGKACPFGTDFIVQSKGYETSVFVMQGVVSVTSNNPKFPEQRVNAGEWVNFRKDMPIPPPQRYRPSDAGSGSSDCIYSNCKITDLVSLSGPWLPPPEVLAPPPFNPPGRK